MKNTFSMILYYFAALFFGTLAAGFVYMVCCDLTLCVAGESAKFFCWAFFLKGMLVSFPLICIAGILLSIFYGISHKENFLFRFVFYVFINVVTWLVLIPASFELTEKYNAYFTEGYEVPYLSSGYFRPESGGVFYFSRVNDNGSADGLFIDLTGITGEKGSVVKFSDSLIDADFSGQFADTLIRDSIKLPFVIVVPLDMYSAFMDKAVTAWNRGYISWIFFCSIALALAACIALERVSSWRLIDAIAVLFSVGFVCFFNYACYYGFIFAEEGKLWSDFFAGMAQGKTGILHSIFSAGDPLLAVINGIFAVTLVLTGLIILFIKKKNSGVEA